MEICMRKSLATSLLLASALVGTMAPSFAGDDTFENICQFPWRVAGSGVGTVVGVPLGAVKDGVRGSEKATKWVAEKLGNADGTGQLWVGAIVGGPVGFVGGGAYGRFDGGVHGARTGYEKPFSKDA